MSFELENQFKKSTKIAINIERFMRTVEALLVRLCFLPLLLCLCEDKASTISQCVFNGYFILQFYFETIIRLNIQGDLELATFFLRG